MTPTTDQSFSIRRAVAFGRLFGTGIRRQMILYPVVAFTVFTFALVISTNEIGLVIGSLLMSVISLCAYFAPLVFAIGSDPVTETLFPATKSEKAALMTVYTFVVIPLLLGLAMLLALPAARLIAGDGVEASLLFNSSRIASPMMSVISNVTALLPMAVCLLSVVVYRHRRVLMPVVWTIVTLLTVSITAGIIGGIAAFRMGLKDGAAHIDHLVGQSEQEIAARLVDMLMPWLTVYAIVVVLATAAVIVITVRKIRNRQL